MLPISTHGSVDQSSFWLSGALPTLLMLCLCLIIITFDSEVETASPFPRQTYFKSVFWTEVPNDFKIVFMNPSFLWRMVHMNLQPNNECSLSWEIQELTPNWQHLGCCNAISIPGYCWNRGIDSKFHLWSLCIFFLATSFCSCWNKLPYFFLFGRNNRFITLQIFHSGSFELAVLLSVFSFPVHLIARI